MMKGLLLKEFYVWKNTRIFFTLYYLIFGIISIFMDSNFSIVILIVALGICMRTFLEDEKSNWQNYSRALPYTSAQIVSARYISATAELLIALVISIISIIISAKKTTLYNFDNLYSENAYSYVTIGSIITASTFLSITAVIIYLAVVLPLNFKFTGPKRTMVSLIPLIVCTLILFIVNLKSSLAYVSPESFSVYAKVFYYEKWVPFVLIVISFLALAASWIISIIIHTNSGKEKLKKFKIIAVFLIVAAVVTSAVSLGVLYSRERLIKDEYTIKSQVTDREIKRDVLTDENINARENMTYLLENFCNETHLSDNLKNVGEMLENLGLEENIYHEYITDEECATVRLYTKDSTDMVRAIDISARVGDTYIKSASTKDINKIADNFVIGMSEPELQNKFSELNLYPKFISEYYDSDQNIIRYYWAQFYIENYNNQGAYVYSVNIDISNGKVIDVRLYEEER